MQWNFAAAACVGVGVGGVGGGVSREQEVENKERLVGEAGSVEAGQVRAALTSSDCF